MNKFWKFVLMLFVLTPLAALQTFAGVLTVLGFTFTVADTTSSIAMGILGIVLMAILALIVRAIRDMSWRFFFFEILVSPIRLILQLVSLVLFIISIFKDGDVDPRYNPAYEHNVINSALRFLLMISVSSLEYRRAPSPSAGSKPSFTPSYSSPARTAASSSAGSSEGNTGYKIKNIFYQFFLLVLTFIHSFVFIYGMYGLKWAELLYPVDPETNNGFLRLLINIGYVLVYFLVVALTAKMKGVDGLSYYYEKNWTEERTNHPLKGYQEITYRAPGWRNFLTLGVIVYIIMSPLWFIPQALTFLLSIIIPSNAALCPCRAKDADIEYLANFSGKKTLHMLTGLAPNDEIDKD